MTSRSKLDLDFKVYMPAQRNGNGQGHENEPVTLKTPSTIKGQSGGKPCGDNLIKGTSNQTKKLDATFVKR